MKEELLQNPVEFRTGVPAPHFDDRSVVQRAQPVVPLAQIRTRLKLRKLWFLGGAFAIAMMLGAASALVAVRLKHSDAHTGIPQVVEPETVTATATPVPAIEEETVVDSSEEIVESSTIEEVPVQQRPAPKTADAVTQRPRTVNAARDRDTAAPSEDEELEQRREAMLYEEWQERRARRAARREGRNRDNDRDLSHLDEIFEGQRRRPERPY